MTAIGGGSDDDFILYGLSEVRFFGAGLCSSKPDPADNAGGVLSDTVFSWTPGAGAKSHHVYLGTDKATVTAADTSDSSGIYRGELAADTNSFIPGELKSNTTYYWRVDEQSKDGFVAKGDIFSFSVADQKRFYDWIANGYGVWIEDSMRRIFPASRPKSYPTDLEAHVSLARREYESFQVVILPAPKNPLRNVTIKISDLVNGENKIDASDIEWHLVGYVDVGDPYSGKEAFFDKGVSGGWWPEVLLPVKSFDVNKDDQSQAVWLTVYAPENTPTGAYNGKLIVSADNCKDTEVELSVTVYDFTLPKGAGHCKTAFALRSKNHPEGYFGKGGFRAYADFTLIKHKLNPDRFWSSRPPLIADLEHYYEQGMNLFNIAYLARPAIFDRIDTFLAELEKSPYGREIRDMAIFFSFDEMNATKENQLIIRDNFSLLEDRYPDIERLTTAYVNKRWGNRPIEMMAYCNIDWVCPRLEWYDYDIGERLREEGYKYWGYLCCSMDPVYPHVFVHCPLIESRVLFWQMYHQKMDGFLYWNLTNWANDTIALDPAGGAYIDWQYGYTPGGGELIYRGVDGPIGSVRLANVRDGIEDYEYLYLLAEYVGDIDAARQICEQVSFSMHDPNSFTHDPKVLRATREQIAAILSASEDKNLDKEQK